MPKMHQKALKRSKISKSYSDVTLFKPPPILEYENCSLTFNDSLYSTWVADINLEDCPNFGVCEFLGGGPTRISIEVNVVAKDNAYTIFASNIFLFFNPMWGTLYGENGQLYPELYTKKQLKLYPYN